VRPRLHGLRRHAAAADPRWRPVQRDSDDFYPSDPAGSAEALDARFAADRRVQADCASAGEDIGPLRP